MSQALEGIVLFKRHTLKCEVHQSKIPVAARRYWMNCQCPVWAYGRMPDGKVFPRQTTHCTDLKSAQHFIAGKAKQQLPENPEAGRRLDWCIERYVKSQSPPKFSESHHRLNRDFLARLQEYCHAANVFHIQEIGIDLLDDFKNHLEETAGLAGSTRNEVVKKVRAFFKTAYGKEWTPNQLHLKLEGVFVGATRKTLPFTGDDIPKLLNATIRKNFNEGYARYPETFRLVLELMLETGLRVSDATTYDPRNTEKGEGDMWVYTYRPKKAKRDKEEMLAKHEVYLTDRLKTAIDRCSWHSAEMPFAYDNKNFVVFQHAAYIRMMSLGRSVGITNCRPHRLRDTFATSLLERNVPIGDVSRLLGHASVVTTEKYYSHWVPKRASRLQDIVAKALPQYGQVAGSNG